MAMETTDKEIDGFMNTYLFLEAIFIKDILSNLQLTKNAIK